MKGEGGGGGFNVGFRRGFDTPHYQLLVYSYPAPRVEGPGSAVHYGTKGTKECPVFNKESPQIQRK